ncbi:hypothetical protein [Nocardioides sp. SYSU DS0663]|uniref:hypothetical protein n=1 Tax=Nocardioides sp. SYSU DS0663 TaxID=3416445 RepID=UPI003F4B4F17
MRTTTPYRLGLALAAGTGLLLVLLSGAVGIVGAGGEADRPYLAVLAVLVLGSVVARLRPGGMAWALAATALAQGIATAVALATLPAGVEPSVLDAIGITLGFMALFGAAAWLFSRADTAGRTQRPGGAVSW